MRKKLGLLRFAFKDLSIKVRLGLLFSFLMILMIAGSAFLLYQQHKLAVRATETSLMEHSELEATFQMRQVLGQIEHLSWTKGASFDELVGEFHRLTRESVGETPTLQQEELLLELNRRFDLYLDVLPRSVNDPIRRERFDDVAASVASILSQKQINTYDSAYNLRKDQENFIRVGIILLALFILILIAAAFSIISFVTKPLSALAEALDGVNIEDDLHSALPKFSWDAPEITRVVASFEQLLNRLRGYRAINVRRLLLEKRRADIVAASISDGIFLLRNDELLYVNPVGERILTLPRGTTWKGLSLNSNQLTGDQAKGMKAVARSLQKTMPVEFEIELEDNRKLYYLLRSYPISEEIIEQVEHAFDGPVEQLLDRWQANTLILAQDVTLAKEGQEAKGHFIATLSHEVKTPVTSLTMATRLLKKTIDQIPNQTQRSLIETCASDVDRLRGLIDNLLSVSKFDALTQKLELQMVDINKLIRQSVQSFQPQAFERGVEMVTHGIVNQPSILLSVDATKISWALSNLLTNALRHAPREGKVEIDVALKDENIEVRIRDNGPGIEKARQERIFDKFNPFYDLRVARTGSVGMGMAIAREIIVAHGGRIWLTSEPGCGAEFCFTLPLKKSKGAESSSSAVSNLKGDLGVTSARS